MDAILPFLCLLTGAAFPLWVLFLLARRAWRQLAVSEAYREASRRLGLTLDTRGLSIRGYLQERRIWIGEVMVGYGKQRETEVRGILRLDRPLGLGLLVRRRGGRRLLRRRRSAQVITGDAELDRVLEFRADNPDRVRELINERVAAAVHTLMRRWPDIVLTDHHVRVYLGQSETSAEALEDLVRAMDAVANALVEVRAEIAPPPGLTPFVDTWRPLAADLGLDFEENFPAMSGTIDGLAVRVVARRAAERYVAEIRVAHETHKDLGLRLFPQHGPDGYWSVGQDIQVEDEAFDRAFVIKGYDPDRIREILSDEARATMLQALEIGPVEVDDHLLQLGEAPLDPATLADAVRLVVQAARTLSW
ncbi:MAG: hypothetical protein EP330_30005 [Deltaproteobacteria bacterium]|nr:MAG: hypothetical protein EP330_30005 [Deltaproteobacteria bacterium]